MAGELKQLLAKGEFIVAPGVFEMFSAKIADTNAMLFPSGAQLACAAV